MRSTNAWYRDAKLGIEFHWGPASVAAFSSSEERSVAEILREDGWQKLFENHPDGRWYLNSLRVGRTEAIEHHKRRFSSGVTYEQIAARFNADLQQWDPAEWVDLCKEAGARYVVLAAKDPDGYLLWPSMKPAAQQERMATRDVVADLGEAVRRAGLRYGLAYSALLDWSHESTAVRTYRDIDELSRINERAELIETHCHELVERYNPDLLRTELGLSVAASVGRIRGVLRRHVDDALLVGLWRPPGSRLTAFLPPLLAVPVNAGLMRKWLTEMSPRPGSHGVSVAARVPRRIRRRQWEFVCPLTRSLVYSEGAETAAVPTGEQLVHLLVDVISRNGNLLISIGPRPDGSIPGSQKRALVDLAMWLRKHGEAVYGTRPWHVAEGKTDCGLPVRFTTSENTLYCVVLGRSSTLSLTLRGVDVRRVPETRQARRERYELVVSLVGYDYPVESSVSRESVSVNIPGSYIPGAATVVKIAWEPPVKAARSAGFFTDVV